MPPFFVGFRPGQLMEHIARVHAMNMYGITDVTMFMLPTTEPFMPWLRKWKNVARGCPRGGSLSAYSNVTCY